ncbi:MAG: NAD(P)H-dependent oxidoreductase [Clostridia bacterium]|nr:NAD(P)H-dependent oxidoreductase [Clostridia bacterium]
MKALILNGAREWEKSLEPTHAVTADLLEKHDYEVESLLLHELKVKNCTGCFGCWVKTPGICVIDDIGRDITKAVIQSDLLVYITPIMFGSVSYEIKKVAERNIPLGLPFFEKINGEVHHQSRYNKYPDVIVLGMLPEKHEEMENIFKKLVKRNELNWHSDKYLQSILYTTYDEEEIQNIVQDLLKSLEVKAC